jgi:hypothetical protein
MTPIRTPLAALGAALLAFPATAAEDKSAFHLFNPTPRELMREMNTDRPDTTESPITVDAGHFQLEMSFFDFNQDLDRGTRANTWSFGQVNLKAGLTNWADLQLVFNTYTEDRLTTGGLTRGLYGFSDVMFRFKMNVWGNDGGDTALGIMPYITIPTGTQHSARRAAGGVIVPFAMTLTERLSLGAMVEADFVPEAAGSGYDLQWLHTIALGISLTDQLGMYLEGVGVAGGGGFDYEASFNCGFTYAVTDDLVLDTGVRIGLNRAAQDFGIFTGISVRF